MQEQPKVGVGVIIMKDGMVLMAKRKGSHGAGTWSFPGGHLEYGESIVDCAAREAKEETGITITNVRPVTFVENLFFGEGKHYITLYTIADWKSGEPKTLEPEKSEQWEWFDWDHLPQPLFAPIASLVKQSFHPLKSKTSPTP